MVAISGVKFFSTQKQDQKPDPAFEQHQRIEALKEEIRAAADNLIGKYRIVLGQRQTKEDIIHNAHLKKWCNNNDCDVEVNAQGDLNRGSALPAIQEYQAKQLEEIRGNRSYFSYEYDNDERSALNELDKKVEAALQAVFNSEKVKSILGLKEVKRVLEQAGYTDQSKVEALISDALK